MALLPLAGLAGLVGVAAGCSSSRPFAAADFQPYEEQERGWKQVLDEGDRAEVRRILGSVAEGHEPAAAPRPAEHGVRFSDMDAAMRRACDAVEMAVVSRRRLGEEEGGGILYEIRTVDGLPARLLARPTGDERVYEAAASVGRFAGHADRTAALLAALDEALRAYGRKPALEP